MDRLYNFALRLTNDEDNAKDLLQECCLTAYENFYQLKDIQKIKPWLFQIMHRKFINNITRREKGSRLWAGKEPGIIDIELDENLLSVPDDFFDVPAIWDKNKFNNAVGDEIRQAFVSLPVEFREVILLADIEGLSYRDTAEILGIPMGTVASRLYRAHSLVKEKLQNYARRYGY